MATTEPIAEAPFASVVYKARMHHWRGDATLQHRIFLDERGELLKRIADIYLILASVKRSSELTWPPLHLESFENLHISCG